MSLWFSSCRWLKFLKLQESQKICFSVFPVLKVLSKIKNFETHSKPPNLVRQTLSKQIQQKRNSIGNLTLLLPTTCCASTQTNFPSNSNISKTVRVNSVSATQFFKDDSKSFSMTGRLLHFWLCSY